MCSFPNVVTETVREIVGETITESIVKDETDLKDLPMETCSTGITRTTLPKRKKFANYSEQLHQQQQQQEQHEQQQQQHRQQPHRLDTYEQQGLFGWEAHVRETKQTKLPKELTKLNQHNNESKNIQILNETQHDADEARVCDTISRPAVMGKEYGKDEFVKVRPKQQQQQQQQQEEKKKSWRQKSRFVLLESLPVIRAIRWAISFVLVIDSACALRLTNMTAPLVADTRNDMHMDCHFDMGPELLYAVKWYKDDQEFFRFMPHQEPNTIMFPVAGVHMQPASTKCDETRCKLRLSNLTREHSGGAYRCEVSTEAPAFRLASETHNVTVATLPLDLPRITGLADAYAMDDILSLECVSGAGDPTPQLTWYINNQPAAVELLGESFTTQVNEKTSRGDHIETNGGGGGGGETDAIRTYRTSITLAKRTQPLRMRIERRHLQGAAAMLVQCVSSMPAMPMVQPQSVVHTIIIRSRSIQVNNEKLHGHDYASSSSSSSSSASSATSFTFATYTAASSKSRTKSYLTSYLSCRNFQILAINLLLIIYYHYNNN